MKQRSTLYKMHEAPYQDEQETECNSSLLLVLEILLNVRNTLDEETQIISSQSSSWNIKREAIIQQLVPILESLESVFIAKPIRHVSDRRHDPNHHQPSKNSPFDNGDDETRREILTQLEFFVNYLAYTYHTEHHDLHSPPEKDSFLLLVQTIVPRILGCISHLYQLILYSILPLLHGDQDSFHGDYSTIIDDQQQLLIDAYLDWAMASKRANQMSDCFYAHVCRMRLDPHLTQTDALRLLGTTITTPTIPSMTTSETIHVQVQESMSCHGIFELDFDLLNHEMKYYPSPKALTLGKKIQSLFQHAGYTLYNCRSIFLDYLSTTHNVKYATNSSNQLFSASVYVEYRHVIPSITCYPYLTTRTTPLDILCRLFLFGLAVQYDIAFNILGSDSIHLLMDAKLIRISPVCAKDILGEAQVFPISPMDLFLQQEEKKEEEIEKSIQKSCLFITDWSVESFRVRENVVMPVGYDTMELMALAGAWTLQSYRRRHLRPEETCTKYLDLCCGCGIQGIFVYYISTYFFPKITATKVVCLDVNVRACQFVAANIAINGLGSDVRLTTTHGVPSIYAMQSDLMTIVQSQDDLPNETFDCIICNPPFVAVPSSYISSLAPALYAVGKGKNGMQILQRVIKDSIHHLQDNCCSILLMVTELPNIEVSDAYIEKFLSINETDKVRIRIAFVKDDVETVQVYNKARASENGYNTIFDWAHTNDNNHDNPLINNRALALVSIMKDDDDKDGKRVYCFENRNEDNDLKMGNEIYTIDEEDVFLTRVGMEYVRGNLL